MNYAKRVKSPLKGGVDVVLGPKTCLVGPNGGGKTAILQALKLGTQGYVDDQEGRDGVHTTASIARLFPPEAALEVEVEMSDGKQFSWSSKPRGKGFTKPKTKQPYDVKFPFQAIKALLSGDDKKIRSWLEHRAGCVVSEDDLVEMLPPVQKEAAPAMLRRFKERSPVELSSALKKEASNLRREATRKAKTIDKLVEGIPLPLSAVAAADLEERKAVLWAQAHATNTMTEEDHKALRGAIDELAGALSSVKELVDALPEEGEDDAETFRVASLGHSMAKQHLEHLGADTCYVCMRKEADVQGAYARWDAVLGDFQAAGSRKRLQSQYDRGLDELTVLVAKYKGATVVDMEPVLTAHSAASASLATHEANKRVWSQAEGLRKEVAGSRATADSCASLGRTWETKGKELLLRRKKAYEDTVTMWLPEGEIFVMDLDAGRVGLAHVLYPHMIRTSLSGAEMSRVLLAVLSAEDEEDSTPSILETEDRGWDPDTLASVMNALTDSPDQVILMSTVPPKGMEFNEAGHLVGEPPGGWSVVPVGA